MRNAFAVCPRKHIAPDDVQTKSVSIREATKMLPRGGQGIFHCDCKQIQSSLQCSSRRCKCKKITEFATAVVITVQNIPARTNKYWCVCINFGNSIHMKRAQQLHLERKPTMDLIRLLEGFAVGGLCPPKPRFGSVCMNTFPAE